MRNLWGTPGVVDRKYAAGRIIHDRPAAFKERFLHCLAVRSRGEPVLFRQGGSYAAYGRKREASKFSSHQASRRDRYQRDGFAATRRLRAGQAEFERDLEDREAGEFQRHHGDQAARCAQCDRSASQVEQGDGGRDAFGSLAASAGHGCKGRCTSSKHRFANPSLECRQHQYSFDRYREHFEQRQDRWGSPDSPIGRSLRGRRAGPRKQRDQRNDGADQTLDAQRLGSQTTVPLGGSV